MKRFETNYFFREGVRGIFLHGFMSFAAVGVIVACLLIMGCFTLLAFNLDTIIRDIEGNNEILVIVDENLSRAEALSLGTKIAQVDNVYRRDFISKETALEEFAGKMDPSDRWLFEGLNQDNPLRDRYEVWLVDVQRMRETVAVLEKLPGVARVNDRSDIVQQLGQVRNALNAVCLLLIVVLMAVSVFIVSNTIKLATFARGEEIAIMRVVGATKRFIRWPFVIEGFLLGLMGAIAAFLIQWRLYAMFTSRIAQWMSNITMVKTVEFTDIGWPMLGVFLLAGFLAGMGGSVLTIRKFLRV